MKGIAVLLTVHNRIQKTLKCIDAALSAGKHIPWVDGNLLPLGVEDFVAMKESDRFFGRKFSLKDIEAYELL